MLFDRCKRKDEEYSSDKLVMVPRASGGERAIEAVRRMVASIGDYADSPDPLIGAAPYDLELYASLLRDHSEYLNGIADTMTNGTRVRQIADNLLHVANMLEIVSTTFECRIR